MQDGTTTERNLAEAINTLRVIADSGGSDSGTLSTLATMALERIDPAETKDIRFLNGMDMYGRYLLPKDKDGKIYVMVRTENRTRHDGELELIRDIVDNAVLKIDREVNATTGDRKVFGKEYHVTLDSGEDATFRISATVGACNGEKELQEVVSEFAKVTHHFYFNLARELTGKSE